jgi:RHS repeat-associated protein
MGGTTTMEYDYTGMRVKKNGGGTTLYPFAGVEIDPNNVMTKFIRIGNENFASNKGGVQYFYHNDHLGGVNVITDITGGRVQLVEYDPWGSVSRSEGNIDPTHKFTGKELDPETGLYYYGGRYYDPEISRFISADPFVSDPDEPQNLNRYSYVNNDPINYTDPSGYFYMSKSGGGGGGLFGMIFTAIIGVLTGNPEIAIASIAIELIVAQMPAKARHGMEIFGGMAMLLGGNPGGMFYVSAGAVGLSGSSGSERMSGILSGLGGLTSFLAGLSAPAAGGGTSGVGNGGANARGYDLSTLGGPNLVNAVGTGGADERQPPPRVIYQGYSIRNDELRRRLDIFAEYLQRNVIIHGGNRDSRRNRQVGGARGSRHLTGDAADISVEGLTINQAAIAADEAFQPGGRAVLFPGVIFEFNHVHIDMRNDIYRGIRDPRTGHEERLPSLRDP